MLGLTPFWATVVRVELINLAFSIDSILVAVAMSPKLWVVITGGILGIVAMRLVAGQLIVLVQRYPRARGRRVHHHRVGRIEAVPRVSPRGALIALDIPKWLSLGIVVVIFVVAFIYARMQGRSVSKMETPSRTKQRRCSRLMRNSSPRSTAT